jgi:hypothetical protein
MLKMSEESSEFDRDLRESIRIKKEENEEKYGTSD